MDRAPIAPGPSALFEDLWRQGDCWELASSSFEQSKYARQLELLGGRRYPRVLEIGCGNGSFTRRLASVSDRVLAIDIAPSAIEQARAALGSAAHVEFREADIMHFDFAAEGPWNLVVLSETIYYLGLIHPFFDVSWLAVRTASAMPPGGRLLMANTLRGTGDDLCRPWAIRTYHDLVRNVGFNVAAEEVFRGTRDGADIEVLIGLYTRSAETVEPALARR